MGIIEKMQAEITNLKERLAKLETQDEGVNYLDEIAQMNHGPRGLYIDFKKKPTRDEVIEMAKRIVEALKRPGVININGKPHPWEYRKNLEGEGSGIAYNAEYIVNKEKRTVVVLLRGFNFGDVIEKGIAKCDPEDCFNIHIGKAIALHRALGLDVPKEFLSAPQPTEVKVGDVIKHTNIFGEDYTAEIERFSGCLVRYTKDRFDGIEVLKKAKIIDDSREGE